MPSMSTQVFFIAASAQDALLVPAAAVTLQRQPARDRSGGSGARGERGGSAASGALSGGSSGVLPDLGGAAPEMPRGVSASSPAPRPGGATASVPMVPTAASAPSGRGGRDGMSKEERRAAFERMTPERQAFRDQHRAAGDSAGGVNAQRESLVPQNVGTSVPSRSKPPASVPTSGSASLRRGAHAPASAASTAGSDSTPRPAVSTSGFADTTAARAPRRGTVRVLTAAGTIEERQIEVGVTTRVQMQVLSGLEEGDEVVAGIKLPASAQQRANASGQGSGPGGPSGAAPGLGGAGRAR
jgi:macrolide-specific efflux system membrane fusion protein